MAVGQRVIRPYPTPPAAEATLARPSVSLWRDAWNRLLRNRMAVVGIIFIAIVAFAAIFADWVAPYPYNKQDITTRTRQGPSAEHWMGTDKYNRDVFSRMMYGGQVSLAVGFIGTFTAAVVGLTYGAVSGFLGGRTDNLMMRFVDVVYAFPTLLFIIMIMVILPSENALQAITNIFIAIGIVGWMGMARLVRGQFLSLKQKEFVEAARAVGVPPLRIITRHLMPNSLGPVIVALTLGIPNLILIEAVLSFIGLGVPPPFPSWGQMINEAWQGLRATPHLTIFPGLAISLTMLAFNFLGDGLRDALDPMMRGTS